MARKRTQKSVSARIDRTYIDRLHRWRRFRLSIVFAFCALCLILVVGLATMGSKGDLIQNPGRLTFVHAKFQNDCAACHDGCDDQGHPTGKFTKSVSDGACLKCHDAGIHHANQATMVVIDKRRKPPEMRSADCTVCHVEHRGKEAMVSTADALCINCHADLTGKTTNPRAAEVPLNVTTFTTKGHPHFGRSLEDPETKKPIDPTVLRFNHKKHLQGAIDEGHKEMRNCTFCHDPNPSAGQTMVWETGKTAFSMPGGVRSDAPGPLIDGSARHDSMTQINYAKDCKVCHDLGTFPNSDMAIPHEDMSLIRRAILAYVTDSSQPWQKWAKDSSGPKEKPLNDRIIGKLNVPADFPGASDAMDAVSKAVKADPLSPALSEASAAMPPDMLPALQKAAGKVKTNVVPAAAKGSLLAAVGASTRPADHVRPLAVANLRDEFSKTDEVKGLSADAKKKMLAQFDAAFARFNQETPDPRLLQVYVAYANDGGASCIKCHDVQGDAAATPAEWSSLRALSKPAPAAAARLFATKPTMIPAGPRRWYTNSMFNHDAHRSMNCVECHASALTSTDTKDVLSPDITWQGLSFLPGSTTEVDPKLHTRSCMECHHPDNAEGPGAASNCTECHVYHDRSHESAPKATPDSILTGKPPAPTSTTPPKPVALAN